MATFDDVQVRDVIFYNDRMYHLLPVSCFFCCFNTSSNFHYDDYVCCIPDDFPCHCNGNNCFERIYL